MTYSTEKALFI